MTASEAEVRQALGELKARAAAGRGPGACRRDAALDRFNGINRELIALSRRNSDVHSLALLARPKARGDRGVRGSTPSPGRGAREARVHRNALTLNSGQPDGKKEGAARGVLALYLFLVT